MELEKILLPIDVAKCPLGIFELVNRSGRSSQATVILLHIVTLNVIAAENRIYDELGRDAQSYLERLASSYLCPSHSTLFRVRLGDAAEQILSQAGADHPDLIVLPIHHRLFVKGSAFPPCDRPAATVSALARKVIRGADCDVLVIPFNTSFDCEKAWGRPLMPVANDQNVLVPVPSTLGPRLARFDRREDFCFPSLRSLRSVS